MGDLPQAHPPAARPRIWHLVTGEYPPDSGGVGAYTAAVAGALTDTGAEVHVWSAGNESDAVASPGGVRVHRVAGRFGPAGLARMDRELDGFAGPRTILIQYVPHAFGWKAMNILFVAWALMRRIRRRDDVRVMFHEVSFPVGPPAAAHNVLAAVNRCHGRRAGPGVHAGLCHDPGLGAAIAAARGWAVADRLDTGPIGCPR